MTALRVLLLGLLALPAAPARAGSPLSNDPSPLAVCEDTVRTAAIRLGVDAHRAVSACLTRGIECLVDDEATEAACCERAAARCDGDLRKLEKGRAGFSRYVANRRCQTVPFSAMLAADGLGYEKIAESCAVLDPPVDSLETLLDCLAGLTVAATACTVGTFELPRAADGLACMGLTEKFRGATGADLSTCGAGPVPTGTVASPTPTPAASPSHTAAPTTVAATVTPIVAATPTTTPIATTTSIATATVVASATVSHTAAPATPTGTATISATATPVAVTATASPSGPTPIASATSVPTITATVIPQPTATVTPHATSTTTNTATAAAATVTSTATPSATVTAITTTTPLVTATPVATATALPTQTAFPTVTPIPTATRTATPSPTRTATATRTPTPVPTPGCGNGVKESGEDCDDGNTSNCDACPSDCKTKFPTQCTASTTRYEQKIHLLPPAGALLSSGIFCITYPPGVVGLPGSGIISPSGRVSGFNGIPSLNDFNNAVQFSFVASPGFADVTPVLSFDLCTGSTAPLPSNFTCVVKSASDQGDSIEPPSLVECKPQ